MRTFIFSLGGFLLVSVCLTALPKRLLNQTGKPLMKNVEDGPLGFGGHSDQEQILESEIMRFARFNWDVVADLARAQ